MRSIKHSRGAALLVAMLVAALVAVVATKVGSHYILSFRRSSNMLLSDQGYLFLLSAEALAKNILIADEAESDHLGELWAQPVEPYVIDGGLLTGRIYDLQGRFNINSLLKTSPVNNQNPPPQPQQNFTAEQLIFIRLLRTFNETDGIEISVEQAQDITNAAIDWLDADSIPKPFSGAEDDYYADLDIPYLAANREMLSASELRLVKGMTAELYKALLPHITALPNTDTKVNTNTATENVLRSLKVADDGGSVYEPRSLEDIKLELERRKEQIERGIGDPNNPYPDAEEPFTEKSYPNASEKTNYFLFEGFVKLGDLTVPVRTVLHRQSGGSTTGATQSEVQVIRRSLGSL